MAYSFSSSLLATKPCINSERSSVDILKAREHTMDKSNAGIQGKFDVPLST